MSHIVALTNVAGGGRNKYSTAAQTGPCGWGWICPVMLQNGPVVQRRHRQAAKMRQRSDGGTTERRLTHLLQSENINDHSNNKGNRGWALVLPYVAWCTAGWRWELKLIGVCEKRSKTKREWQRDARSVQKGTGAVRPCRWVSMGTDKWGTMDQL